MDFYNEVSLLYGTIIDFCTRESCPVMSAGRKFEYLWADGVKVKSPIKVPAPDCETQAVGGHGVPALTAVPADVDYLMEWIDGQLSNASLFPVTPGAAGSARGSGCASRVRLALTPPLRPLARRGSLPTKVPEPRQSHL